MLPLHCQHCSTPPALCPVQPADKQTRPRYVPSPCLHCYSPAAWRLLAFSLPLTAVSGGQADVASALPKRTQGQDLERRLAVAVKIAWTLQIGSKGSTALRCNQNGCVPIYPLRSRSPSCQILPTCRFIFRYRTYTEIAILSKLYTVRSWAASRRQQWTFS